MRRQRLATVLLGKVAGDGIGKCGGTGSLLLVELRYLIAAFNNKPALMSIPPHAGLWTTLTCASLLEPQSSCKSYYCTGIVYSGAS